MADPNFLNLKFGTFILVTSLVWFPTKGTASVVFTVGGLGRYEMVEHLVTNGFVSGAVSVDNT